MSFEFAVSETGQIASAGVVFLNGTVNSGTVRNGDTALVKDSPEKRVKIKSVALVNSKDIPSNDLTLSIESPDFPLDELKGSILISATD